MQKGYYHESNHKQTLNRLVIPPQDHLIMHQIFYELKVLPVHKLLVFLYQDHISFQDPLSLQVLPVPLNIQVLLVHLGVSCFQSLHFRQVFFMPKASAYLFRRLAAKHNQPPLKETRPLQSLFLLAQ